MNAAGDWGNAETLPDSCARGSLPFFVTRSQWTAAGCSRPQLDFAP